MLAVMTLDDARAQTRTDTDQAAADMAARQARLAATPLGGSADVLTA
jgi:hypothetical protein